MVVAPMITRVATMMVSVAAIVPVIVVIAFSDTVGQQTNGGGTEQGSFRSDDLLRIAVGIVSGGATDGGAEQSDRENKAKQSSFHISSDAGAFREFNEGALIFDSSWAAHRPALHGVVHGR